MAKRRRFKLTDPQRFTAWLAGAVGVFLTCMAAGSGYIQLLLVAALVLVGTGLVVLMLRRTGGRTVQRRVAHVIRASRARPGAIVGPCTMELLVKVPGEQSSLVKVFDNRVPLIKWPRPGMQLPVDVSRRHPNNLRVRWDLVLPQPMTRATAAASMTGASVSGAPVSGGAAIGGGPGVDPFGPADAGPTRTASGGSPFQGHDRLPSAESSPGFGADLEDLYAGMDPEFIAEMKRLEFIAEMGALDESYDPDAPTVSYDPDGGPRAIEAGRAGFGAEPTEPVPFELLPTDPDDPDPLAMFEALELDDPAADLPDPDAGPVRAGPSWPNVSDHPAGPEDLTDLSDESIGDFDGGEPGRPEPRNPFPVTPPSQRTDPGLVEPFVITGSSRRESPTAPPPATPPANGGPQVEAEPELTTAIPAQRPQIDDDEAETVRLGDEPVAGVADLAAGGVGVMLVVSDLTRSLRFYRETLGFRLVGSAPGSAVLSYGGGRIMLRRVLDMSPVQRRLAHVQIAVSNVDDAYQRLRAKGVEFMHRPQASRVDGLEVRTATLRDPDGHAIALTEWRTLPS